MDPAIHAAIVEGVIGGSVVLGGILLTEGLTRGRERWERLVRLVNELHLPLARFRRLVQAGGILAVGPGSADGVEAQLEARAVLTRVLEVEELARRARTGRAIESAADDLACRMIAAQLRAAQGTPFTYTEIEPGNDTAGISDAVLRELVLGEVIDEGQEIAANRIEWYRSNGLTEPFTGPDAKLPRPARGLARIRAALHRPLHLP